jgi:hypothetical protein
VGPDLPGRRVRALRNGQSQCPRPGTANRGTSPPTAPTGQGEPNARSATCGLFRQLIPLRIIEPATRGLLALGLLPSGWYPINPYWQVLSTLSGRVLREALVHIFHQDSAIRSRKRCELRTAKVAKSAKDIDKSCGPTRRSYIDPLALVALNCLTECHVRSLRVLRALVCSKSCQFNEAGCCVVRRVITRTEASTSSRRLLPPSWV